MIARERLVIRNERKIIPPGMELHLINDSSINAISTKIDDEYCIFVYKGIIEEQKEYLSHYDWNYFSSEEQKEKYLDDIIEYGFYFITAHEYAHIFCGHLDASLIDPDELIAEECEADMFSMDYLIKYIQFTHSVESVTDEVEKLFFAVYFIFENMQRQNYREFYSNELMQNYYDPDKIQQRDHPLDTQRDKLHKYADYQEMVIAGEYSDEGKSGKSVEGRPEFMQMLSDIETGNDNVDYVLVWLVLPYFFSCSKDRKAYNVN